MSPTLPLPTTGISRFQPPMALDSRSRRNFRILAVAETAKRTDERKLANLYEVLRVKETASSFEIKTAYRSLAKQFHPDAVLSNSDGRDFIEIHDAYAMLSDPAARARYDLSLGAGRRFSNQSGSGHRTRRWETDQCW